MAELKKELSIFISYAREDIEAAKRLYGDLQKKGLYPWFDRKSILAGEKWEYAIREAIKNCRYFLALLSSNSVTKKGFVNKEITLALEILEEYPESDIYIIPVRLDDCTPSHEKLKEINWVDMFANKWEEGLGEILRTVINGFTKKKDELDDFVNDLTEIYFSGKYERDENTQRTVIDSYLEVLSGFPLSNDFVDFYTSICKKDKKFYTSQELFPMLQKRFEDEEAKIDEKTITGKKVEEKIREILEYSESEEGLTAVIVGIDGYKKRPLQCAVNDAVYLTETLQKVWKERKVTIRTLIWPSLSEEKAASQRRTWGIDLPKDANIVTRENILSVVRQCAELARESDTFIFYFSGHAALTDGEPTLLTVGDGKTAEGFEYIKITEIQQAAGDCASYKKVMILDGCQGLPVRNKNKTLEGYKNLKDLTQEWSIFLSSGPGEISLEDQYFGDSRDDYLQQGIFTASLVEGLRGEAADRSGLVTLANLAYFVGKRVPVEYQERLLSRISSTRGNQSKIYARGIGLSSQNPVLLSDAVSMGGPYKITMAPVRVLPSFKARKKLPGPDFRKYWFKFLIGQWPIRFPSKLGFSLGALWYAATMMLTVFWHFQKTIDNTPPILIGIVGLGSVFLWWSTLPFAVAANESRWHPGGYLTFISYLLWHCMVAIGFAWLCGIGQNIMPIADSIFYLAMDLFFILVVVIICGCNASQTIIALAETIRSDERRDIRQAIRIFQQFKYTIAGVDLYTYVPMISARPDFYFSFLIISIIIIGLNTSIIIADAGMETVYSWVFLIRNIIALIFVTWLVFWYLSAFKFIQREVYKR